MKYDVIFTGFYGQKNYGDDLFCALLGYAAPRLWGLRDVAFMGYDLPSAQNVHSSFLFGGRRLFKGQAQLDYRLQPLLTNWVVAGGGSIFHSDYRSSLKGRVLSAASDAGRLNLGAIGVSVGPFPSVRAKDSVRDYLRRFRFLALRDVVSVDVVRDFELPDTKLVAGFDLAGLLPEVISPSKVERGKDTKVIGVCLCGQLGLEQIELHLEKVKRLLDKLSRKYSIKVLFYVLNTHPLHGEFGVYDRIIHDGCSYEYDFVVHGGDPLETAKSFLICDFIFAVRLHAGVTAAMLDVPFVQVEYHEKCSSFLDLLNYPVDMRVGGLAMPDDLLLEIVVEKLNGTESVSHDRRKNLVACAVDSFASVKDCLDVCG
jgi:polysaccharide pyruvyl transferase WcaK-like protein